MLVENTDIFFGKIFSLVLKQVLYINVVFLFFSKILS